MRIFYGVHENLDEVAAGASFYYYEISRLLSQEQGIEAMPITRKELLSDNFLLRLKENDVLVPNIGPYAWFYYHLRAKKRLKFRIMHDVQTALFADHLLQEQLCEDFLREGDSVLFLSQFQKYLYMDLFPDSLDESNTFVCNPILRFLPDANEYNSSIKEDNKFIIGWFGRVFDAKNFGQALEAFIRFYKDYNDAKMVVCGLADERYKPQNVRKILQKNNIPLSAYEHVGNGEFVEHFQMLNYLRDCDVLLFPSAGNMESFGRVMLEANHLNVKVLAANHGAASELLPASNLLDVKYYKGKDIDLNSNQSMGEISVDESVDLLQRADKLNLGDNSYFKGHDEKLFKILLNEQKNDNLHISQNVKDFVARVNLFLNNDFHWDKHSVLDKASAVLLQHLPPETFDIVKTSLAIREHINYKPYLRLIQ